ncbi:exodeoxyribonuclease V subunit beta [Aquisalimonas lutea]|uniref:exodeoxyribonuclease V subunit beta n=1 Tax=Aquisalimonas lutea TaxID=1327750 RepID=UPI0025B570CD|nr:exodeoxyribonuclease V subunit beta [Aquisalimonas lutea]MDN3518085.1 exodeoxyribonuclease V subunit beta [Aquisalimonas lutea]
MSTTAMDTLRFPLHGTRLIEASAGTGKTYTLTALYVRLVLGHGDEAAFERPLLPPEILVVTFTEAATRELRERIRNRLAEAARCFAGRAAPDGGDAFLQQLLAAYPEAERPAQADRLDAAAQWMDEAAVYTIHGFANRMLRQHAFDSGSLFDLELMRDEALLLEEAARDYWRTFCYHLGPAEAEVLRRALAPDGSRVAPTPDDLLSAVRPVLADAGRLGAPGHEALAPLLRELAEARTAALEACKRPWRDWVPQLRAAFEAAWGDGRLPRSRPSASKTVLGWLDRIEAWAADPEAVASGLTDTAFQRLTPAAIRAGGTDVDALADHPALAALPEVRAPALPDERPPVLHHAACWIAARLDGAKRGQGVIGFQDMLTRLDEALSGANGDRLTATIRRQYPVALIDEFQDTDPVQYAIFEAIYRDRPETGWFMIGDPKQAIYAFRGADIYTYLTAKSRAAGGTYTLATNYRSAGGLVQAVNRLFGMREQAPGDAFLLDARIPFERVEARGREQALQVDGAVQPGMTVWHLERGADGGDPSFAKGEYVAEMAARTASAIVDLLQRADAGAAGFADGDAWRPLQPSDMAILVRDRTEADAIRGALRRRGLNSVYLSDKESVFRTDEAADVLRWLKACAEPGSESAVRAALATGTLDLSWQELDALGADEQRWEATVQQFLGYHRLWRRRGVLPMLRRLLHDYGLPQRLLARDDERRLTNLLHLAELLQTAATQRDGETALVRWLQEQVDSGDAAGDESILRLESDAGLIRVVTIHKSKGLEYPLVFLPFICTFRAADGTRPPLRYHDDDGRLQVTLEARDEVVARMDRERLAEDLRLLYVAVTRARHACWLGAAPMRSGGSGQRTDLHRTALGYLLAGGEAIAPDSLGEYLRALAAGGDIRLAGAPEVHHRSAPRTGREPAALAGARVYRGPVPERWWIASYSALRPEAGPDAGEDPRDAGEEITAEELESPAPATFRPSPQAGAHGFLRGPLAGTFLHGVLEEAAGTGFDRVLADGGRWLRETVAERCRVRGWDGWAPVLTGWLADVLTADLPLGAAEVRLAALTAGDCRAEMEFMLQADGVTTEALDRLVHRHVLPGQARPALRRDQLNGMLKGFVDLVFAWRGRYYVIDYKSNWLGDRDAAYSPEAMAATVLDKRQDVQYSLYLLALHRLLRARRRADYRIDAHLGGAALLFLRGIGADGRGVHFQGADPELVEGLDALFAGRASHVA